MIKHKWWLRAALAVILAATLGMMIAPASVNAQDNDFGACGDPATPIHDLQGTGDRTPEAGNQHVIEGVVVADLQDTTTQFGGFFMQEETADFDDDPLTSEGIFVDSSLVRDVDVKVGDVVRVMGTAFELSSNGVDLTQLRRVRDMIVCDSDIDIEPIEVILPVTEVSNLEAFEGMLVTFPQELTVTQLYNLGRYGNVMVSADGRLFQPTQIAAPGDDALAVEADNARRTLQLDDGNNQQNIDPTFFPTGGLSIDNFIRSGYTVSGVTGVLDQRFGEYVLQVTQPVTFEPTNPRTDSPPDVGGTLRVASFNVLNYFNGDGAGGGYPTERGANTPEEFERQRAKIISAIMALDAHVVGLIEIENDGDGAESSVADLVNGLNEAAGEDRYAYVSDPEGQPAFIPDNDDEGGDAIRQAIIYQPDAVTPVGDPVLTLDPPFDIRRPPVAQAFEENSSGEVFIVVVNHFKSKGCSGAGVDPDLGDGQGCWNLERVQAAHTIVDWLATDPTGAGDTDVLLLGDLNAYAFEDPVMTLIGEGYTNLTAQFAQAPDYSYIYFGQAGTLDYAMASESMLPQVTGAAIWHVNADETNVLNYNIEYKSDNHIETLYAPIPARSSDHDPVLVGIALSGEAEQQPTPEPTDEPQPTVTDEPTPEPTEEPAATATDEPTAEPTDEPQPTATDVPTPEPAEDDAGDEDLDDGTPGLIALIAAAAAVLLAIVLGALGQRRKP